MTYSNRTKASALLGLGVAVVLSATGIAQATTGHDSAPRARIAHAGAPYGTSHLLQSDDYFSTGLDFGTAAVDTTGRQALTACSGEKTMAKLTHDNAAFGRYAGVIWSGSDQPLVTESIAQAPDSAHARRWTRKLKALVAGCQREPKGHWHYGRAHVLTTKDGQATWRLTTNGDGTSGGGVAVIRSGLAFGVVELGGSPTDDARPLVKSITRTALHRLA